MDADRKMQAKKVAEEPSCLFISDPFIGLPQQQLARWCGLTGRPCQHCARVLMARLQINRPFVIKLLHNRMILMGRQIHSRGQTIRPREVLL